MSKEKEEGMVRVGRQGVKQKKTGIANRGKVLGREKALERHRRAGKGGGEEGK
jgi:hypothetical protein